MAFSQSEHPYRFFVNRLTSITFVFPALERWIFVQTITDKSVNLIQSIHDPVPSFFWRVETGIGAEPPVETPRTSGPSPSDPDLFQRVRWQPHSCTVFSTLKRHVPTRQAKPRLRSVPVPCLTTGRTVFRNDMTSERFHAEVRRGMRLGCRYLCTCIVRRGRIRGQVMVGGMSG